MRLVLLTALGVGGATIIGAVIGFAFKKITHKFTDIVLAFSAGVMLAAAVFGLIVPSLEYGGDHASAQILCPDSSPCGEPLRIRQPCGTARHILFRFRCPP